MHPLRQALQFGADPCGFVTRCQREYGDIFTMRLPGDPPRVVLCDPQHVKTMFALGPTQYRSDRQSVHFNLGAHSVLFADGAEHRRQRTILQPPLHGPRLRSYADQMHRIATEHADAWPLQRTFTLHPTLQAIALDVILQCVFGVDPDDRRSERLRAVTIDWLDAVFATPWLFAAMAVSANRLRRWLDGATLRSRRRGRKRRVPVPWGPVADHKAALLAILAEDVAACRRDGTQGRDDVLAMLVDARDEDGVPMDDEEVLDQLVTMLVGGHETTAVSLCWAMYHLLANPPVLERLRAELTAAFGDGPVDPARCAELPWLAACIDESMRLSPIALAIPRHITEPLQLGEHRIPGNTIVWPCVHLVHRRADTYADPERYDPQRFLDGATPRPERFFPFGGGRRRCLGAAFAQFEMRIVVATIVHRCRLGLASTVPPKPVFRGITIAPADSLPVVLDARV